MPAASIAPIAIDHGLLGHQFNLDGHPPAREALRVLRTAESRDGSCRDSSSCELGIRNAMGKTTASQTQLRTKELPPGSMNAMPTRDRTGYRDPRYAVIPAGR